MAEATHRIEVTEDPHSDVLGWDYRIFRLTDGMLVRTASADTQEAAITEAREWVRREKAPRTAPVLIDVDSEGETVGGERA